MISQETLNITIVAVLLVMTVIVFACGGFEMMKTGLQLFGGAIWKAITWPMERRKKRHIFEEMEKEWQKFMDTQKDTLIEQTMNALGRQMFGVGYKTEDLRDGASKLSETFSECGISAENIDVSKKQREERVWQEQIMNRFMRIE